MEQFIIILDVPAKITVFYSIVYTPINQISNVRTVGNGYKRCSKDPQICHSEVTPAVHLAPKDCEEWEIKRGTLTVRQDGTAKHLRWRHRLN
ncbi:jg2518 [Pararge aegeria aegeria]|uniref:Jg2518 protein n=1 Tax=Pararge aegeria aegeria TaxID=348720 RepID=A0A8S4S2V6_9NEOP|nr:jg2518 [Pararge aegeria aegeria]